MTRSWCWWLCAASVLVGCWLTLPSLSEGRAYRASKRNYYRQRRKLAREYRRAKRKKKYVPCRSVQRLTRMKSRLEGYLEPDGMRGSRYWKRKLRKLFRGYVRGANRWISRLTRPCEKRREYLKHSRQITRGYSDAVRERKRAPCRTNAKLRRYKMLLDPDNAANWSNLPRRQRRSLSRLQRKYRKYTRRRMRSSRIDCRSKHGSSYKAKIAQELAALQTAATKKQGGFAMRRTPPRATVLTPVRRPAPSGLAPRREPPPIDLPPMRNNPRPTPRRFAATPQPRRVAAIDGPGATSPGIKKDISGTRLNRIDQPLFLTAGMKFFSRTFFYSDDLFGVLRPYNLLMAPALQIDARWHPLAHFMKGALAHIGIIGQFYYALGLGSRTPSGEILSTNALGFHVGLCGRIPVGPVAIRLSAAYGQQLFAIGQEAPKSVPDVAYQWLRLAAGLRWMIADRFSLTASFAYLIVFDGGELTSADFFPRASIGGIDGRIGLSFSVLKFLDINFGVRLQHYFHSMNPEPGDRRVAGGAVDQYLNFELGATFRF